MQEMTLLQIIDDAERSWFRSSARGLAPNVLLLSRVNKERLEYKLSQQYYSGMAPAEYHGMKVGTATSLGDNECVVGRI